ncbi:hypothetical protein Droror1_Dr00013528 [Drosera rotundifolia]
MASKPPKPPSPSKPPKPPTAQKPPTPSPTPPTSPSPPSPPSPSPKPPTSPSKPLIYSSGTAPKGPSPPTPPTSPSPKPTTPPTSPSKPLVFCPATSPKGPSSPSKSVILCHSTARALSGVIVEVTTPDQAKIAESAGACAVSVNDPRLPNSRMADRRHIRAVAAAVKIPVVAKCRVGHFVEAQIIEAMKVVHYIDENELLCSGDHDTFIDKRGFKCHFICGARDIGEALRRISEGASMIRTQGDMMGSGQVAETMGNVRRVMEGMRELLDTEDHELILFGQKYNCRAEVVDLAKKMGRLPALHFAAGGIVTPADAALMRQLGCDGVFVDVEVFDDLNPETRIRRLVEAVSRCKDIERMAEVGILD